MKLFYFWILLTIIDVTQRYAHSCHWNNTHATINPFVLYYLNLETKEFSNASFSCISNHRFMILFVYAFLKTLINDHTKTRQPFPKSITSWLVKGVIPPFLDQSLLSENLGCPNSIGPLGVAKLLTDSSNLLINNFKAQNLVMLKDYSQNVCFL